MKNKSIAFLIVIAEFAGTSLWFGSNAVISPLSVDLGIPEQFYGYISSSVQLGFILGTLVYAIFGISDKYSPSLVFFISSLAAALSNLLIGLVATGTVDLLLLRLSTGFFLAGIYPIGMKIAADWFADDLGKALGFLVGALVLGTAFPHLLTSILTDYPWRYVLYSASLLASIGGLLMIFFVGDGPYRKKNTQFTFKGLIALRTNKPLLKAAMGYFGHMWELYAFWAFIPVFVTAYQLGESENVSSLSFIIIGSGTISCIIGGLISKRLGSAKVAFYALVISGACCLLSPLAISLSLPWFMAFMILWGMAVIIDSPQLSSTVAQHAPATNLGSTLTMVNCIGFSITIVSIQLLNYLLSEVSVKLLFLVLAIGPIIALYSLKDIVFRKADTVNN